LCAVKVVPELEPPLVCVEKRERDEAGEDDGCEGCDEWWWLPWWKEGPPAEPGEIEGEAEGEWLRARPSPSELARSDERVRATGGGRDAERAGGGGGERDDDALVVVVEDVGGGAGAGAESSCNVSSSSRIGASPSSKST